MKIKFQVLRKEAHLQICIQKNPKNALDSCSQISFLVMFFERCVKTLLSCWHSVDLSCAPGFPAALGLTLVSCDAQSGAQVGVVAQRMTLDVQLGSLHVADVTFSLTLGLVCDDQVGMVAWRMTLKAPEFPARRDLIVIDMTHLVQIMTLNITL